MSKVKTLTAIAAAAFSASSAMAVVDLQITEIWAGGLDGDEFTSDWFEVTNFGDTAMTDILTTNQLWFDDSSAVPTAASQLLGIDTIAPGESVIFMTAWDDLPTLGDAQNAFQLMWGSPNGDLTGVQVGYVDGGGAGLGGGGDEVNLFDGGTGGSNFITGEEYTIDTTLASFVSDGTGNWTGTTFAQVGVLGAYDGNFGATTTITAPPIGSPGVVPEPTSLALLGLGGLMIARRRRA